MSRDEPCDSMNHRLPFVVGITGNRDLKGLDARLGEAVAAYFREFRRRYPHTPVLLLSSLAAGADQVVAASVLALRDDPKTPLDVSLVTPLPMPDRHYRVDFAGPEDEPAFAEYQRLKRLACRVVELPLLSPEAEVAPTDPGNDARNLQYLLAGAFIARRCHVLLAAWDGEPARGIGGTADVVGFKRSGRLHLPEPWRTRFDGAPDPFGYPPHPIEVPETGPVVVFPLSGGEVGEPLEVMPRPLIGRASAAGPAGGVSGSFDRLRNERGRERKAYFDRFDRIHKGNLEGFNEQAWRMEEDERRTARRDDESRAQLPVEARPGLPGSLAQLADVYATADRLALDLQSRVHRLMIRGVRPIILGVAAFAAYAHLAGESQRHWYLTAFLGLLAIAYAIYLGSHPRSRDLLRQALPAGLEGPKARRVPRHDDKNSYQDYRTLAEGLRVQLFWRLAGMPDFVSDYYLTRQKNEVDWIRMAIGAWGLLAEPAPGQTDLVQKKWVVSQLVYYIRASYRDRISHLIYRQMAAGLIVAGVLVSIVLAACHIGEARPWADWRPWWVALYALALVSIASSLVRYALAKWQETHHEVEEDEEEFHQNDTTLGMLIRRWPTERIEPPPPIPRAFLGPPYAALRALIRWWKGARGRPRVVHVANASFTIGCLLGLVVSAILTSVTLFLPDRWEHDPSALLKKDVVDWAIVSIAVNAAIAALLQWYSEKQALGEQYRQYKRTKMTFLLAHEALEPDPEGRPPTPPARVFKDLGRESLAEHADWLLLRRERPLELAWPPA